MENQNKQKTHGENTQRLAGGHGVTESKQGQWHWLSLSCDIVNLPVINTVLGHMLCPHDEVLQLYSINLIWVVVVFLLHFTCYSIGLGSHNISMIEVLQQ